MAHDLGFGRLYEQLPLEIARPRRKAAELAAFLVRLPGGRLRLGALARKPFLGRAHGAVVIGDADLHGFDLGAQSRELDPLAVRQDRTFAEFGNQFRQVRLLVGERTLGFARSGRLNLEFLLGGAQLVAQILFARLEGEDRCGLCAEFFLELVDGVALFAELGKLAGRFGLHLLDAQLQPPRRHGEFGAQLIFVGADFGDGQRRCRLQPPHGQPDSAIMDQRDEQQSEQRCNKEPDPEIHDRFDHDTTLGAASRALHCHAQEGGTIIREH